MIGLVRFWPQVLWVSVLMAVRLPRPVQPVWICPRGRRPVGCLTCRLGPRMFGTLIRISSTGEQTLCTGGPGRGEPEFRTVRSYFPDRFPLCSLSCPCWFLGTPHFWFSRPKMSTPVTEPCPSERKAAHDSPSPSWVKKDVPPQTHWQPWDDLGAPGGKKIERKGGMSPSL